MSISKRSNGIIPMTMLQAPRPYATFVLFPALLLIGCGQGTDASTSLESVSSSTAVTSSVQVDASVAETPCALVTVEMLAAVFDVPAGDIEQTKLGSLGCEYTWKGDDQTLYAQITMADVFADAKSAASRFRSVTTGLSGAELDRAMEGIKQEAAKNTDSKAADALIGSAAGSKGIVFEDVTGVGDEARFALTVGAGDLYVRVGNLNFTVAAYSGPSMPMPSPFSMELVVENQKVWHRDTMPQRKQDATKLAEAVIAAL